jgi:hypothetical protein
VESTEDPELVLEEMKHLKLSGEEDSETGGKSGECYQWNQKLKISQLHCILKRNQEKWKVEVFH